MFDFILWFIIFPIAVFSVCVIIIETVKTIFDETFGALGRLFSKIFSKKGEDYE